MSSSCDGNLDLQDYVLQMAVGNCATRGKLLLMVSNEWQARGSWPPSQGGEAIMRLSLLISGYSWLELDRSRYFDR